MTDRRFLAWALLAPRLSARKLFLLVVSLEAVGLYAIGLEVVDSAVLAFRRWQ